MNFFSRYEQALRAALQATGSSHAASCPATVMSIRLRVLHSRNGRSRSSYPQYTSYTGSFVTASYATAQYLRLIIQDTNWKSDVFRQHASSRAVTEK